MHAEEGRFRILAVIMEHLVVSRAHQTYIKTTQKIKAYRSWRQNTYISLFV
jgi:hypothetical protein